MMGIGAKLHCIVALLAVGTVGCATLNKDDCVNADWRTIGYQDGALGKVAEVIGNYREDCAEHGVKPDLNAYLAGREQGLREYCREANGFRIGHSGKIYHGVCPGDLEYAFKVGYRDGREIYELAADIRNTERDLQKKTRSLDTLDEELSLAEAELISDGVGSERRAELLLRTRELAIDIGTLQNDVRRMESDLSVKRDKLQALRDSSPYL
ncbi:MAG: DUF2799 domain-containing protein [Gammaproteobacteria bacterium]|nr:DUF2799 domain-containing protein [Gammaproteobacteria bacterium]